MEESEKMTALKKAYAEIILNTAKEAAARVLVLEKRSVRLQQDLSSTKDEALRLLVRLKQMIDAKTMEAEKTSLNQRGKIDELEAQLHEAEDIITDLRSELRYVQEKLEKVKKNKPQPLNGEIKAEDASFLKDAMPVPVVKTLDDKCCKASEQDEKSDFSHLESKFEINSDITSMLMRSKEPELYRNGCTQRIRALERKLLDENLPSAEAMEDPSSLLKNELSVETADEHEEMCMISSPKTKSVRPMISRDEVNKPVRSRTSRRKKTRLTRVKSSSRKLLASQLKKLSQPFQLGLPYEAKIKTLPHLNNTIASMKTLNKCRFVQNAAYRNMKLRDKSVSLSQDGDTKVVSTLPSAELSLDMVDEPQIYSNVKEAKASEETDSSPTKVANERFLKYTFQRKRKKESLSDVDEKTSAENSSLKRRAGWRQNDAQETDKSSLMNEMSRDSRRMAQVARQLISLSGKRW